MAAPGDGTVWRHQVPPTPLVTQESPVVLCHRSEGCLFRVAQAIKVVDNHGWFFAGFLRWMPS